jgi:CheY-like chemotaxis protein
MITIYNMASLELPRALLATSDYRIVESSDGHDALAKVESEAPDVVLLDIQISGLDGFEVLHAIRGLEPPRPRRIFALTAFAMEGDRVRILASGFGGYIAKPVSISDVREQIRRLLNSSSKTASHEF